MLLDEKAIVEQIDEVLAKCDPNVSSAEGMSKALSMMLSAIRRLAPSGSIYADNVQAHERFLTSGVIAISIALEPVRGMLLALRNDYAAGYLRSVVELVHADVFADFLDMADYLIQQGYKDPAAVVAGSVLEGHLRNLCDKRGVAVVKADGTPKKADALNSDLTMAGAYSKLDQKSVTAWLDLRNKAAHGKYSEYTQEQVALMIQAVRDFASRYSA
jgi:hypothetical protein